MVGGSSIGGMKETQEMIDFAAKHGVKPDIEVIPIDYVNTAIERLAKADVKYRFVIDIGNTLKPSSWVYKEICMRDSDFRYWTYMGKEIKIENW